MAIQQTPEKKHDPNKTEGLINAISEVCCEQNRDFIKYVLEQKNYNESDVINDFFDEAKKE